MTPKSITEEGLHTLTRIGMQSDRVVQLNNLIRLDVDHARAQGCSWRMIAVALGTTTQAAWERFRTDHPETPLSGQGELDLEMALQVNREADVILASSVSVDNDDELTPAED